MKAPILIELNDTAVYVPLTAAICFSRPEYQLEQSTRNGTTIRRQSVPIPLQVQGCKALPGFNLFPRGALELIKAALKQRKILFRVVENYSRWNSLGAPSAELNQIEGELKNYITRNKMGNLKMENFEQLVNSIKALLFIFPTAKFAIASDRRSLVNELRHRLRDVVRDYADDDPDESRRVYIGTQAAMSEVYHLVGLVLHPTPTDMLNAANQLYLLGNGQQCVRKFACILDSERLSNSERDLLDFSFGRHQFRFESAPQSLMPAKIQWLDVVQTNQSVTKTDLLNTKLRTWANSNLRPVITPPPANVTQVLVVDLIADAIRLAEQLTEYKLDCHILTQHLVTGSAVQDQVSALTTRDSRHCIVTKQDLQHFYRCATPKLKIIRFDRGEELLTLRFGIADMAEIVEFCAQYGQLKREYQARLELYKRAGYSSQDFDIPSTLRISGNH